MRIHRIDHVGIIVHDLDAAKTFFLDLGFEVQGEGDLAGSWLDHIVGLNAVQTAYVMLALPDGQGTIELIKYDAPLDEQGVQQPLANTLGIRHIAFVVEHIEAMVAQLQQKGATLVGEITPYEDSYKLCYIRGPEGIILELAEPLNK